MPKLKFSNWWFIATAGIVLLVFVAAQLFAPSNLNPVEMRLTGTWKQTSPESSKLMTLGPDRIYRITESTGKKEVWTGRWRADDSNFFFTVDDSRLIGFFITRLGWGRSEDQIPILSVEDGVFSLDGTEGPIVYVRDDKN